MLYKSFGNSLPMWNRNALLSVLGTDIFFNFKNWKNCPQITIKAVLMLLIFRRQMSVTDTNDNIVLKWNTEIQIVTKSYLKTLKRSKNQYSRNMCSRITMAVALEAYLEPNETSAKGFFWWIINRLKPLTIFAKKTHGRFSAGF